MIFNIETERLILRELRLTDLDGMFELDSDPEVHKYLGNKPVKTREESQKIIENVIKQYDERGIGRWAAIEKSSGEFIGWSGLRLNSDITFNTKTNFYDVGYRLIKRYWGKGYASESSVVAIDYFFNTLQKSLLCGIAETENIASNRILEKVGLKFINDFKIDGVNAKWYELKKEEYAKRMP